MNPKEIYLQAHAAGVAAVADANVEPMIVVNQHSNTEYFVRDGVCGFAWVQIKPANSKFAKWIQENNIGRKSIYEPGVRVSISDYNQSLQKKEAYASAFAKVLNANGIKAVVNSRMD